MIGSVAAMLALLLVAVSLGLSNFAASIGIGVSGVDARTRLRVGVIFGVFESVMPILGLLAGRSLAGTLAMPRTGPVPRYSSPLASTP